MCIPKGMCTNLLNQENLPSGGCACITCHKLNTTNTQCIKDTSPACTTPTPTTPTSLGGCSTTFYGCCKDGKTGKVNSAGGNCPSPAVCPMCEKNAPSNDQLCFKDGDFNTCMVTVCDFTKEVKKSIAPYCDACPMCEKPNPGSGFTTCF